MRRQVVAVGLVAASVVGCAGGVDTTSYEYGLGYDSADPYFSPYDGNDYDKTSVRKYCGELFVIREISGDVTDDGKDDFIAGCSAAVADRNPGSSD